VHHTKLPEVILRPADARDCDRIFHWRNDPVSRANSRTVEPINHNEHVKWYAAAIVSPSRKIFIAEIDGQAIGMVRADAPADQTSAWTLSWIIAPEHRGRKLLAPMLIAATSQLKRPFRAEIRQSNEPSCRGARRAGFRLAAEADGFGEWHFDPEALA